MVTYEGHKLERVAELFIISDKGELIVIKHLSPDNLPPLESDGIFTHYEMNHNDRYFVMEWGTDIFGNVNVFDLKAKKHIGNFLSTKIPVYRNNTLYVYSRGEFLGDDSTSGHGKYEVLQIPIYNSVVGKATVVDIMLSH